MSIQDFFSQKLVDAPGWGFWICVLVVVGEGVIGFLAGGLAGKLLTATSQKLGPRIAAARFEGLRNVIWRTCALLLIFLLIRFGYNTPFLQAMRVINPGWPWIVAAFGAAILNLTILGLLGIGAKSPTFATVRPDTDKIGILLMVVSVTVFIPIGEEFTFRGVLYPPLAHQFGSWVAILAIGLLFSLIHGPSRENFFVYLTAGILYTWLRAQSDSILPSILCHSVVNTILSYKLILALSRRRQYSPAEVSNTHNLSNHTATTSPFRRAKPEQEAGAIFPQLLNVQDLRARHARKQKALGSNMYMGITITEHADVLIHSDGTAAMRTPPAAKPPAELLIVLTKGQPPTKEFLSNLRRIIPNMTAQTRSIVYGISAGDWNDYALQGIIDSLIFVDFPEFFPMVSSIGTTANALNLTPTPKDYVVDYYRDTQRQGTSPVEPVQWVYAVVHKIRTR